MSVFTGYKDILIRKVGEVYYIDGLSPEGHKWVDNNIACAYTGVYPEYIGPMVTKIVSGGLSVEIR